MTINSTDPFAYPLIDPGLLSEDVDIAILREGIRSARRFVAASSWKSYVISPAPTNNATTDAELDDYIRSNAVSFFHPVATTAISPAGATWGVVDPDLKVKGTVGLRIVDAGVAVSINEMPVHKLLADAIVLPLAEFASRTRYCSCICNCRESCRHH